MKEIFTLPEHELDLSERCDEIDLRFQNEEAREIIKELKDTIRKNKLRALSAPAIGYKRRIFCIAFDEEIKTFINPAFSAKGLSLSRETCTSIPGKTFIRPRNNDINVIYQDPMGRTQSREMVGMAAYIFEHEMDHLDGLLLSDIALEIDEQFDNATQEEREEVINAYLDCLDLTQKELKSDIENDPEAKEMYNGIKFMESVAKGEVKFEKQVKN